MRIVRQARRLGEALKRHPRIRHSIELGVFAVVIALCVYGVKDVWATSGPKLEDANIGLFGIALATITAYYLVFIVGWMWILAAWKIQIPYRVALQAEMASMLAKYVPGGVWTPAARVAALVRLTGETQKATVLASILVEAVLSALSGVIVFVVSLAWVRGVDAPLEPLIAFAVLCAVVMHPRVFRPLTARLLKPFGIPALDPLPFPTMIALLGYYCLTWLVGGFGLYFLIRSLGENPGLDTIAFLGGVSAVGAIVAVVAVFAPSGLGVREASMYGLLIAITSKSTALGATILNRLAITIVEVVLFGIGIIAWRLNRSRRAPASSQPDAT